MIESVKAVGYVWDGGDGGGRVTLYSDLETLKKKVFYEFLGEQDDYDSLEEYEKEKQECDEKYESALSGDNPHDDGLIKQDCDFQVEVDEDTGEVKLIGEISIQYGQ